MSGTKAGGVKARNTNYDRYGKDYYKIQGAKGGKACVKKGFGANPALARVAGRKGGKNRWAKSSTK